MAGRDDGSWLAIQRVVTVWEPVVGYSDRPEHVIADLGAYHSLLPNGLSSVKSKTDGETFFL